MFLLRGPTELCAHFSGSDEGQGQICPCSSRSVNRGSVGSMSKLCRPCECRYSSAALEKSFELEIREESQQLVHTSDSPQVQAVSEYPARTPKAPLRFVLKR